MSSFGSEGQATVANELVRAGTWPLIPEDWQRPVVRTVAAGPASSDEPEPPDTSWSGHAKTRLKLTVPSLRSMPG